MAEKNTSHQKNANLRTEGGQNELESSFLRLFSQYSRRIYAFVLTILPNHTDADEVFQNTSIILWKKFDSYDPEGSFISWACRIAYLEMLALHRQGARTLPFDDQVMQSMIEEMENRQESSAAREDALRGCLEKLDVADRSLIEHRYYHQQAPKTIAKESDRSIHSVYRSLSRIHIVLRDCVERTLRKEMAP